LAEEPVVGLDVETTLGTQSLCLIQIATPSKTFLIDALELADLSPVANILSDPSIRKIIHRASFERSVLQRHGMTIANVVDTMVVSKKLRGAVEGGHSLKAVARRELGQPVDKEEQCSDWTRRPLTPSQLAYAAVDAEILVRLYDHFEPT